MHQDTGNGGAVRKMLRSISVESGLGARSESPTRAGAPPGAQDSPAASEVLLFFRNAPPQLGAEDSSAVSEVLLFFINLKPLKT